MELTVKKRIQGSTVDQNTKKNDIRIRSKRKNVIPGFGYSLGITLTLLSLIVLIPMASLFLFASKITWNQIVEILTDKSVISCFLVSIRCALGAALINCVFGVILAWILVRYEFFGKRFVDGLIELPFALPTAVAGIVLTSIYSSEGWIGKIFDRWGIQIAYTQIGITIALIFIGIPFVVRAIQPVLEKLDVQYEEAAMLLGADRRKTFFKIIFPEIFFAMLTGFGLALARGLGEYGSVVFIAGNIPYETQIVPLLIMTKLEQFNYAAATVIALIMLSISFFMLFAINIIQGIVQKRTGSN